jgi:hypothetical protein
MSVLHRLARRIGWQLVRHPATRAKAAQALAHTERLLRDDVAPRVQRAWRDAQPEITHAKHRLARVAKQLRDEYRKGSGSQ